MRKPLPLLLGLVALAAPAAASAHPLGNFTVNRFGGIELSGDRVYVHYVLDLAEIPTFQERDTVRRADFPERIARGLVVRLDGRQAALRVVQHKLHEGEGVGGLPVLRFDAVFEASGALETDAGVHRLVLQDTNFRERIGWKEVVVTAERGAELRSSTVPTRSVSAALRSYPKDLLRAPLDVTSGRVVFEPGSLPGTPPVLGRAASPERERKSGGFESLISNGDLRVGVVLVSLTLAMFWGAAHALTPGHGKAIVASYLVGSRGKPRHALALGLIVTVTHTIGVFALGLVTLALSRFVVPERLYPWLTLVSGALVIAVGVSVLRTRIARSRAHARARAHGHLRDDRHHHDHHHHGHGHGHGPGPGPGPGQGHEHELGCRGLLGVGVAAGLLPCPSALVVLLSAIALHRVGFGLALIVAFSLGLAVTISTIGLLAVLASRAFTRLRLDGPVVRALPAVSALLILAVGVGITANALPDVF